MRGGLPTGGTPSASIWFGSAASWINLGQFLPPGYGESVARAVAFENGHFYASGYAYNFAAGRDEAMLWVGVPAPGAMSLLGAAGLWAAGGSGGGGSDTRAGWAPPGGGAMPQLAGADGYTSPMRYAMIMAGGAGTRLWPMSRKERTQAASPVH